MKVRKIKAMRDRQLRRHLADWWESTVTVRHYLHLLAAVRARQKARALGVPASAYLAKIEADPRRAAALQRARDRAPGVAERHPRCGYPYCACVGQCFAASQPGAADGAKGRR